MIAKLLAGILLLNTTFAYAFDDQTTFRKVFYDAPSYTLYHFAKCAGIKLYFGTADYLSDHVSYAPVYAEIVDKDLKAFVASTGLKTVSVTRIGAPTYKNIYLIGTIDPDETLGNFSSSNSQRIYVDRSFLNVEIQRSASNLKLTLVRGFTGFATYNFTDCKTL